MIARDDIPEGVVRDDNGRVLSFRNGEYWEVHTRDENGYILSYENSEGVWHKTTRDENGRLIRNVDSDGFWYEYTRDRHGNVLSFKSSIEYWYEYTRDDSGGITSYTCENFSGVKIASDYVYNLFWDKERDLFTAGCRIKLTREKALNHWDRDDKRAKIFTEAINNAKI